MVPRAHPSSCPKRHLDRSSRFSITRGYVQQKETPRRQNTGNKRLQLCTLCMRCGLMRSPGSLFCHIINGKQLQNSLSLAARAVAPTPPTNGQKLHEQRGYQLQHVGLHLMTPRSTRTLLGVYKRACRYHPLA